MSGWPSCRFSGTGPCRGWSAPPAGPTAARRATTDAAVETLDLLAVDACRHTQFQQRLYLVILEGQLARVEQQQLMLDPQLGHAQFGQASAAHQQGHPARHMPQEEAQAGDQLGVVQHLELVEHDQDRLVLARQFGQQLGEQRIQRYPALLGQRHCQRTAGVQLAVQRLGQVATELQPRVVAGMQLEPAIRPSKARAHCAAKVVLPKPLAACSTARRTCGSAAATRPCAAVRAGPAATWESPAWWGSMAAVVASRHSWTVPCSCSCRGLAHRFAPLPLPGSAPRSTQLVSPSPRRRSGHRRSTSGSRGTRR